MITEKLIKSSRPVVHHQICASPSLKPCHCNCVQASCNVPASALLPISVQPAIVDKTLAIQRKCRSKKGTGSDQRKQVPFQTKGRFAPIIGAGTKGVNSLRFDFSLAVEDCSDIVVRHTSNILEQAEGFKIQNLPTRTHARSHEQHTHTHTHTPV